MSKFKSALLALWKEEEGLTTVDSPSGRDQAELPETQWVILGS